MFSFDYSMSCGQWETPITSLSIVREMKGDSLDSKSTVGMQKLLFLSNSV